MRLGLAALVAVAATGCTGGAAAAGGSSGDTAVAVVSSTPAHRVAWKPLVTLQQLGAFRTHCTKTRFAASFTAAAGHADDLVRVRLDGVPQEPLRLAPGQTRFTPLRRTHEQVWRIVQGTEPQTITATVAIRPARCPYGVPKTTITYGTSHSTSR